MENPIKVNIRPGYDLELHQENPESNCYELIFEDGEQLDVQELMALNAAGFVYHSALPDVEFEDELENGGMLLRTMDIYYFAKVSEETFNDCIPF